MKTRLLTWDDVEDDDLDVGQCLLDDDEVYKLIQDQKIQSIPQEIKIKESRKCTEKHMGRNPNTPIIKRK